MKPHITSRELSAELYDLKGWGGNCDVDFYYDPYGQVVPRSTVLRLAKKKTPKGYIPAFSLGFLIRQLPTDKTPEDLIARLLIESEKYGLFQNDD